MLDKTTQLAMQSQMLQAEKMEAVGRLAGGIAHDFNNMLTVIRAYSEILVSDIPATDAKQADALEILNAANKAADLVGQLLTFSRHQVSHPIVLDVNPIVRHTEAMVRHIIPSNVRVAIEVRDHPACVRADPNQLEQLLLNLAINGSDAMPEGGCLTLSAVRCDLDKSVSTPLSIIDPGSYICIGVRDTGIGMDAETLSRAFDPFFTTKPLGKGTGLGLATVHGIAGQSGGHVVVVSEPGRGSNFRIYLPRISTES
jgi:signal transduction histidine kinase